MAKKKRNFEFIGPKGEKHTFSGKTPGQAAKKVATRFGTPARAGKKIEIREKGRKNKDGTYSLHQYLVGYKKIRTPFDAPDWLGPTAKEPIVKKIGVRRVDKIPK